MFGLFGVWGAAASALLAWVVGVRRVVVGVWAGLLVVGVLGVVAPSVAVAARAHAFSFAFGAAGSGSGGLSLAASGLGEAVGSGVAVDTASGDVFVADTGNRRVDVYDAAGVFVRAWGWGVATGAAELQVCGGVVSCRAGLSGSQPGEFEAPTSVAVDNAPGSPSVYVGDSGDQLVSKFTATGVLVTAWGNNGENASHERVLPNGQLNGSPTEFFNGGLFLDKLAGVAVDASGDLWVFDENPTMFKFDQAGVWLMTCGVNLAAKTVTIAVSEASGGVDDLYVVDASGRVQKIVAGCDEPGRVTTGFPRLEATGLGADSSDGSLYVDENGVLIEDIPSQCVPSSAGCSASQVFGEEPGEPLGGAAGLAVEPEKGIVYVANSSTDRIVVFDTVLEAKAAAAGEVLAHSATLHGKVNPEGVELSRCTFEYGETEAYGLSVPCEESLSSIGSGSSLVDVQAKVTGLTGGANYHFRLHAANAKGSVPSEDEQFKTLVTARIDLVASREVAASSAVLQARVNPEGLSGTYRFEYGACAPAGCAGSGYGSSVPVPDGALGAGVSDVTVAQPVTGLTAGVSYHFRVVGSDVNGSAVSPESTFVFEPSREPLSCENEVLRAENRSAGLPDCRAYEMVTPPSKDGALIDNGFLIALPAFAEAGGRVISPSIQCFAEPLSCVGERESEGEPFEFTRTATGWMPRPLAPPASFSGNTTEYYNAETGAVLYVLPQTSGLQAFYARAPDGTLQSVGPTGETGAAISGRQIAVTGDLATVVYEAGGPAWAFDEGHGNSVYEYTGTGNARPAMVGVSGGAASTSLIGACGTQIGSASAGASSSAGSLSSDGRAVFFTVLPCETGTGVNVGVKVPAQELYARFDRARSVLVSAPAPEPACDAGCQSQPAGDASFEGASVDGSRVFFTSTQQLLNGASEDHRSGDSAFSGCALTVVSASGCNLYEFECPAHCEEPSARRLVDVSAGDSSGLGPQVQGVVAVSPDGSRVYFVARGVLSKGANSQGGEPVEGEENLYVYEGGHVVFVTTLSPSDREAWSGGTGGGVANVTGDGGFLVFTSHRGLTADATPGDGAFAQVYRYDAQHGTLVRVSVGAQGFNDNGNAGTGDARIVIARQGLLTRKGFGRADPSMSENGGLVFFESPVGLTPGALNDHAVTGNPGVLAENVYEWEANGTLLPGGGVACQLPAGCVSLISDGRDLAEGSNARGNESTVELLGVDSAGENVFFTTADQLVPSDTDSQVDYYDARVNGGFPAPKSPAGCGEGTVEGEVCRGAPSTSAVFGGLPSGAFSGGNTTGVQILGGGVLLTPAQELAAALKACRAKTTGKKRMACEALARKRYRARLLAAALKACHKEPAVKRRACERHAHARYPTKAKKAKKAAGKASKSAGGVR